MPLLFSYGTLQRADVQMRTFGRRLVGQADALVGFERAQVPITDPALVQSLGTTHHADVVRASSDSRVEGTVLEVTDHEIVQADGYEAAFDYERIEAALASGRRAWVYVHVSPRR